MRRFQRSHDLRTTGPLSSYDLAFVQSNCFLQRARSGQQTSERVPTFAEAASHAQALGLPIAPDIKIPSAMLMTSYGAAASAVVGAGSGIVAHEYRSLTPGWIAGYHERGLRVWTWTVDDATTMRRLWYPGANGIFTNYPARARAALR